MPRRAHDFRGLTQPRRLQLLRALQRAPGRTAGELASECGIPLNTVRDHLRVLEDEGLLSRRTRRGEGPGRPWVVFHPVREAGRSAAAAERTAGAGERGRKLRAVTEAEVGAVTPEALHQMDVLYEHLDDAGLEPAVHEQELRFDLSPCRYHDMIDEDRALVCGVHARLVADVLGHVDGPLRVGRLEPFVTPHRCRLSLIVAASPAVAGD